MTQLERIKLKLRLHGYVTRNQCLSQFPAITRLGARIEDLERKERYVFRIENTGPDYVYHLVSTDGVPFGKREPRRDPRTEPAGITILR
jgi:hypothetical protein